MGTSILSGIRKMASFGYGVPSLVNTSRIVPGGMSQLSSSASGAVSQLPTNYLKNTAMLQKAGKFGRFLARHPKLALFGGIGAIAGGSVLGSNMMAKQKQGEWYNQGHQAATGQLGPIIAARHAPQGAMSLPAYARR